MDLKSKIILISGPTASGKSNFAIKLAKKIKGEIINADSMQVYKQLQILTARPKKEDLLVDKDELNRVHMLRKVLSEQEEVAATEFLISKLKNTKTNEEFFASMTKSKSK